MTPHERSMEANGTAALGICESLLLALIDLKVLRERVHDLLRDVAVTHQQAAASSQCPDRHIAVADVIQQIIDNDNGVPR